VTDEAADVAAGVEQAELRALVREALSGVGPAEREVLELQIRQGLGSGEVASVLGISRNHVHALMSRARDQLEAAIAVLVVARGGRQDCPELDALLRDWDGRLTVLLRKRLNRHLAQCRVCSGRRQREMTPAMLLGAVAPVAALPLATALPAGLRGQVLRAAAAHSPAAAARTAYPFARAGFPRPLHPPKMPWWHPRPVHAGAVAGTAAAVVVGAAVVAAPPHHGGHPAVGSSANLTDGASPTISDVGRAITPGARGTTGTAGADGTAAASVTATASGTSGGSHASASATPTASAAASASASALVSASASSTTSTTLGAGTLTVSPATLDVVPPASGAITLTASGGTVDWSVSEPAGLAKKVTVAPMSGTLAAGATATITVTVTGPGQMHMHVTFSPGGTTVTIVISNS
jgi:hypothetical protein